MEEKDVQRLLDMLYGMIDEAKSAAFSSDKCVINRDEALDLLDEIRAKLSMQLSKYADELEAASFLRRAMAGSKSEDCAETLINRMKQSKSNKEFISMIL